jgi:hypothetical protein
MQAAGEFRAGSSGFGDEKFLLWKKLIGGLLGGK